METIFLKNHIEVVKKECLDRNEPGHDYSNDLIDQAIQAQIKNCLRYRDGKTFDSYFGINSEYVNKSEIPNYKNPEEAARWEFSGHVRNSASRIKRGYTAI